MRSVLAIVFGAALTGSAAAYDEFITWRINGAEIISVEQLPMEIEAPGSMNINLVDANGETSQLLVESDAGIEDCYGWALSAVGNENATLEITQWNSADTMNGVIVTSCFVISRYPN
ncbi:MAG: hypothetical protein AAFR27_07565 [Pseudomonadota bacterium]